MYEKKLEFLKIKKLGVIGKSTLDLIIADSVYLCLSVLFTIIFARTAGAAIYGELSLAFLIMIVQRSIVEAGYELLIPREIAADSSLIPALIKESQVIRMVLFLASLPILIPCGYLLIKSFNFVIFILIFIPWSVNSNIKAIFRGMRRTAPIAVIESAFSAFLYGACLMLLLFVISLELIYIIFVIIEFIKSYVYWKTSRKHLGSLMPAYFSLYRQALNYGYFKKNYKFLFEKIIGQIKFLSLNILATFQFRAPAFLLGALSNPFTLGIYASGQRFLTVMRIIPGALFNVMLPEFSIRKSRLFLFAILIISFLLSSVLSFLVWFFADWLMKVTFDFKNAVPVLQIMAFGFPIAIIGHISEAYLLAMKKEFFINIGLALSIVLIIILMLIKIIPEYAEMTALCGVIGDTALILYYLIAIFASK